jgi:pyrroloquinoline quinone (PQQ) biosynthesis protein C
MYAADNLAPLEGVAVFNVAAEGVNVSFPGLPGLSDQIFQAVTKHYRRSSDDALFWEMHDREDQEHSSAGVKVLADHVKTEEQRDRVRSAVRMTADAWYHFVSAPERWTMADCLSANSSYFF